MESSIDPYDLVRVVQYRFRIVLTEDAIVKEMENHACVPLVVGILFCQRIKIHLLLLLHGKSAVIWRTVVIIHQVVMGYHQFNSYKKFLHQREDGIKTWCCCKKFQIHRSLLEWVTQSNNALATVLTLSSMSRFDDSTIFHKNSQSCSTTSSS